jgi:hypothetical protein
VNQKVLDDSSPRTSNITGIVLICLLSVFLIDLAFEESLSVSVHDSDFSSFRLSSLWVLDRPVETPLYYPIVEGGAPNPRLLSTCTSIHSGKLYPWASWGQRNGQRAPKFYLYPPVFAVAFIPFALMPLNFAFSAWELTNIVFFIAGVLLLAVTTRPRNVSAMLWASAILAVALVFYPVKWSIILAQNSLLLFLPWVALIWCLVRKNENAAGILLAILAFIKLTPILLLPWLLWRRFYRTLIVFGATALALLAISISCAGSHEMRVYFEKVVPILSGGTAFLENQSLTGMLLRLDKDAEPDKAYLADDRHVVKHVMNTAAAIAGIQLLVIMLARQKQPRGLMMEFCGWTLFLLMVSPISWTHHLVLTLIPIAFLAGLLIEESPLSGTIIGLVLVVSCGAIGAPTLSHPAIRALHESHPLWLSTRLGGMFLLWCSLLFILIRDSIRSKHAAPIPTSAPAVPTNLAE